jgi:endonuclease YncB( thermonuclease family)
MPLSWSVQSVGGFAKTQSDYVRVRDARGCVRASTRSGRLTRGCDQGLWATFSLPIIKCFTTIAPRLPACDGRARPEPTGLQLTASDDNRRRYLLNTWPRLAGALLFALNLSPAGVALTQGAERFAARVESVADGDSLTVRAEDGKRLRIRLSGIDAPELGQDHADESREQLRLLLGRQLLEIEPLKTDPFGRLVARVRLEGEDVALWMVRNGHAWHFARYESEQPAMDRVRYRLAQSRAQSQRLGLWQATDPVAPWDHRAAARRR